MRRFRTLVSAAAALLVAVPVGIVRPDVVAAAPVVAQSQVAVSCPAVTSVQGAATPSREAPADRPLRTRVAVSAEQTYAAPAAPRRMIPADEYPVRVTLRNTTADTWLRAEQVLSYHWRLAGGGDQADPTRLETELPADLAPGQSIELDARVRAPRLADIGNSREQWVLRWDLRDRAHRTWLSETGGVATLDQEVTVEDPTSDQLGLEKFYQYGAIAAGAGSQILVNQFSGNAVFNYDALSNPSRGPGTFVRLTYNSQDTSDSYVGSGWSLSTSTLTRLGTPLEFRGGGAHPAVVTMVDGDGTGHEFELNKHGTADTSKWTYDNPAGVNILLQRSGGTDDSRRWVMTSPDRTRTFFDEDGYQTATADSRGNEMRFTYERATIGNRNTGVLKALTDASGRRTLTLDYYQPGDSYAYFSGDVRRSGTNLANAAITYQLKSITDVSGRTMTFVYGDDGRLQELVDGAGTAVAKAFGFFYAADRSDTKLVKVVDPNGNGSTLAYFSDPADRLRDGHLRLLTNRVGGGIAYDYADPDGSAGSAIRSTVTDPNGHSSTWLIDGFGRPEQLTNAKGEVTTLVWDADNNVIRLRENNGAITTWEYDPKTGMPLQMRDAEGNAHGHPPTTFRYRTDLDGHVADLVEQVTPEGRRVTAVYDEFGDVVAITDPKGNATAAEGDYTTRFRYDEFGHLITVTDANGGVTTFGDYDVNGSPRRVTDALNCTSFVSYDAAGNAVSSVDAAGRVRTFTYDIFKRPLSSRVPKDAAAGQFIVTPGPVYDANDNVVKVTSANGSVLAAAYDEADRQVSVTAPKDTADGPARVTTFAYDRVGNLIRETDPKGNLTPADPRDFVTTYTYDEADRPVAVLDAAGQKSTMEYDNVGNVVREVDPNKNRTVDPDDYTTRYEYDLNRRLVKSTDAAGHSTTTAYDRDGNPVRTTDEEGNETVLVLDERAMPVEVRSPHRQDGGTVVQRITRFEYDQVGNRTKTVTPRGVETAGDPEDFVQQVIYDKLNRPIEELLPYDPDDAQITAPDRIRYGYDAVGALREVSAPPSQGQTARNTTRYTYFDNGWVRSATDPWGITTSYDYNALGLQTRRSVSSAGGAVTRTMSWDYFPDGKLRSRSDDGVPVGRHVVLVDNSDANDTEAAGDWATVDGTAETEGFDYRTHGPGNGDAAFVWRPTIPADGQYEVSVRYARGTATDARYTVEHDGGSTTRTVDQTQRAGEWVSLGTFPFSAGDVRSVRLTDESAGTVVADAVRLARDNSGDTDNESKTFTHAYDANANLVTLTDSSPGAVVDRYAAAYDQVDRLTRIQEFHGGALRNTTSYEYDANSNLLFWQHDDQSARCEYDARDLVTKVTNRRTASGATDQVSTFTYTPRGYLDHEVKPNGNTVDFEYYLDGLLRHRLDRKADGTVVNEHTLEYNANGDRTRDDARTRAAGGDLREHVFTYAYDPRDRIRRVTKTTPAGAEVSSESYAYDANNNIVEQTKSGVTTTFRYDRNRLVSVTGAGVTLNYGYDPFGRLLRSTVAGQEIEHYAYDGFDRVAEHRRRDATGTRTTTYTYDPLDRTRTRVENGKTTELLYQGLSDKVLSERVDGTLRKSYHYAPSGNLIAQVSHGDGGDEDAYVGYNARGDVESLTGADGNPLATYGYTAYGSDDPTGYSGADQPDQQGTAAQPYNSYRFNAKRFDTASGTYDMGFRDYSPAQSRFLSLDSLNGALSDLGMGMSPLTSNRYAFGGGNPIGQVEIDGHKSCGWNPFCHIGEAANAVEEWWDCTTNIMCPKEDPDADGDGYVTPGDLYQNYAEDKCREMSDWRAQSICAGAAPGLADIVDIAADLGPVPINQASRCFQGSVSGCVWTGVAAVAVVFDAAGAVAAASAGTRAASTAGAVGRVAYGSTDLSQLIISKRWTAVPALVRVPPNGAVIEAVVNGTTHTAWAFSYSWRQGGAHAERLAWAILQRAGVKPEQVTRVYSELAPCVIPSGCSRFIAETFPNARVTWSFEYGTSTESRRRGVQALQDALDILFG
ncbi:hypothetical protein K1W54_33340 [Micromonospora sp. CPCC 205371]|nr:hypothetical protein [Micromonospora sp. CPCC 205371]